MPIPNEIIEQIRASADIVDIIGDYVRLRRTGKNWVGLCPFHGDKRPSFAVEPVRGIYKCFACGKGGNVFTFLMESNHWSFPEAVRHLGGRLRIEIPGYGEQEEYSEYEQLMGIVREAALYFYHTLQSDAGSKGRLYFHQRGFTNEAITKFGLGYAEESWEGLITHLVGKGYSHELIERAGLSIKRDGKSGWYDRFRGRVLFPVFTIYGKVAGFGARLIEEGNNEQYDAPKYLNSPDSVIYQKSKLLYGLYQAKEAIRKGKRALLVEGYSDVITLHQAGIEVAVATCGTAVTTEHAEALARLATSVVVMFDGDRSGNAASYRGIDILLKQGLDVCVLRLPHNEDPDSFIRNHGVEAFQRKFEESVPFLTFRLHEYHRSGALDTVERKAAAIRELVRTVAQIPDTIKRELYAQEICAALRVSEKEMTKLLREVNPNTYKKPEQERIQQQRSNLASAEYLLLAVLVQEGRAFFAEVLAEVDPSDFTDPLGRRCLELLLERYCEDASIELEQLLLADIDEQLREALAQFAFPRWEVSSKWATIAPDVGSPDNRIIAHDCIQHFKKQRIQREREAILERISNLCDGDHYEEEIARLFKEMMDATERYDLLKQPQ